MAAMQVAPSQVLVVAAVDPAAVAVDETLAALRLHGDAVTVDLEPGVELAVEGEGLAVEIKVVAKVEG